MRTLITGGTVISMNPAIRDPDPGGVLLEDDVSSRSPNTSTRRILS
jgi:hypothetical protein